MKLKAEKYTDYILISLEAENDAEKHQLAAIHIPLFEDGADFYEGIDTTLVNEDQKRTVKSISVRVRLRPMPENTSQSASNLNVKNMDELIAEKVKEFREAGYTPEIARAELDRNRAKKADSFGAAIDRCAQAGPLKPSPPLSEEEGRAELRRLRDQKCLGAILLGDGWRELEYGEIIQPTDEYFHTWSVWKPIGLGSPGGVVGEKYDPIPAEPGFTKPFFHIPIRRKIHMPNPEWISANISTDTTQAPAPTYYVPPSRIRANSYYVAGLSIAGVLVDVEEGWRLLEPGEVIVEGDEWLVGTGEWSPVLPQEGIGSIGEKYSPLGHSGGYYAYYHGPHRRRVAQVPNPAWFNAPYEVAGFDENGPVHWRELYPGELIEEGDEFQVSSGKWVPVEAQKLMGTIGERYSPRNQEDDQDYRHAVHRRHVIKPPTPPTPNSGLDAGQQTGDAP